MFDQTSGATPAQWTAADLDAFVAALARPLPQGLSSEELAQYWWALQDSIEACDAARAQLLKGDNK